MPRYARLILPAACALLPAMLHAQRGGGDWMTVGNDAQRSFWLRADGKISPASMSKPGFEMVWKTKLNNSTRQLQAVTPPALLDFYISYRGFRTLGFFGGSSNSVIGVDTDLARIEWEKHPIPGNGGPAGTLACPGGMTSAVTRPTSVPYPPAGFGRGFGRASGAKSGVGEPNEGSVQLRQAPGPRPGPPPVPPAAKPGARTAAAPNPFSRSPLFVYSVTGDGKLHAMYVSNGEEPNPPVDFLPANANARGLMAFDGNAYVATVNGCGGVENGMWAINLKTNKVSHWKATGSNVSGLTGFAAGPEGAIYVASGSQLVELEEATLNQKAVYNAGSAEFTSSPIVFEFKGKNLIAAATSDGRVHVVDAALLEAPAAKSDVIGVPGYATGALASWQEENGARWILVPAGKSVVALKLVDEGGALKLETGWTSREMVSPLAPTVVNGVVFALSSGEFRSDDPKMTAAQRSQKSSKAVLYALDAVSGKELWNSGAAIGTFVTTGGISAGGGRVYVSGIDGTQYAFGFPMEH